MKVLEEDQQWLVLVVHLRMELPTIVETGEVLILRQIQV
jgi:hypothetical protein